MVKSADGERKPTDDRVPTITDQHGDSRMIRRGPRQHETLNADQLQRVGCLAVALAEVHPQSLVEWVDDFCRDAHPENEIALFEAIAAVYHQLVAESDFDLACKKGLYEVLVSATLVADISDLNDMLPHSLPPTVDATRICEMLDEAFSKGGGS
jgi:hypothetical protein